MIAARPLPVLVGEVSATFSPSIAKVLGLTRHYMWVCLRACLCICFVCLSVACACLFWLAINSQLFRTVFTQADPYHELGHGSESYNPLICYRNNSCLNVLWFDKWAFESNCWCLCTLLARNAQFLFNSTVLPCFWCLKSALILLLLQS